jgi:hypothetical protein
MAAGSSWLVGAPQGTGMSIEIKLLIAESRDVGLLERDETNGCAQPRA